VEGRNEKKQMSQEAGSGLLPYPRSLRRGSFNISETPGLNATPHGTLESYDLIVFSWHNWHITHPSASGENVLGIVHL